MKLLPIFKQILREGNLKSGAFWIDDGGRLLPVDSTHFKYIVDNLGDFDYDSNKSQDYYYGEVDSENHVVIEELYQLAFDKGWIRLVVGSYGKTADVEYRESFDFKAMAALIEKLLGNKDLELVRIENYAGGTHAKRYEMDDESDKEDFVKKYGRYLK